jgi:hypothetical protein
LGRIKVLSSFERGEQSPEPLEPFLLELYLLEMGGWRRCEKGGNRTAARETHTLTRTLTGTYTRTGTFVRIATNREDPLGQGLGGEGVSGLLVQGYALRNCVWSTLRGVVRSLFKPPQVRPLFLPAPLFDVNEKQEQKEIEGANRPPMAASATNQAPCYDHLADRLPTTHLPAEDR